MELKGLITLKTLPQMGSAAVDPLGEVSLQRTERLSTEVGANLALRCARKWILPLSPFLDGLRRRVLWHRCCEAVETPSRDGAELSVSRATPWLEPASGRKQRSTIYKAEFVNLLTCFNTWMGFVLNFGSLSFALYWLIPHTLTNLGFGANF